jgi:hypothetical protein
MLSRDGRRARTCECNSVYMTKSANTRYKICLLCHNACETERNHLEDRKRGRERASEGERKRERESDRESENERDIEKKREVERERER